VATSLVGHKASDGFKKATAFAMCGKNYPKLSNSVAYSFSLGMLKCVGELIQLCFRHADRMAGFAS